MRSAGTRLLQLAQTGGTARADLNGTDLFALVAAPGWLNEQPSFAPRAGRHFDIIASTILAERETLRTTSPRPRQPVDFQVAAKLSSKESPWRNRNVVDSLIINDKEVL